MFFAINPDPDFFKVFFRTNLDPDFFQVFFRTNLDPDFFQVFFRTFLSGIFQVFFRTNQDPDFSRSSFSFTRSSFSWLSHQRPVRVGLHCQARCDYHIWRQCSLLGDSGGVINSLDFCLASLKSLGCFYFWCVLSSHSQWKAVTVNLRIFTLPTLKAFLEARSHNMSGNLLLVL